VIGVDLARFADMSVIYPRRGMDARSILPLTFRNIPLDRLEDHRLLPSREHGVRRRHWRQWWCGRPSSSARLPRQRMR
jgi:hypothetical protein